MFKGGACITFPTPSGLTFSPLGVFCLSRKQEWLKLAALSGFLCFCVKLYYIEI
nr:MAG TPA: hypothetical protein [Caudoviricetes sp.]